MYNYSTSDFFQQEVYTPDLSKDNNLTNKSAFDLYYFPLSRLVITVRLMNWQRGKVAAQQPSKYFGCQEVVYETFCGTNNGRVLIKSLASVVQMNGFVKFERSHW